MIPKRASGVLMHISSLPSVYSVGDFGADCYRFIDFLAKGGFTYWQVLPFCMTDECNSPYKSYSAFGGNPWFVSLDLLHEDGLLTSEELTHARQQSPYACEYERLRRERLPLLARAAGRVRDRSAVLDWLSGHPRIAEFCSFMALKEANGQKPWYAWRVCEPDPESVFVWAFIQYAFFTQWQNVRAYANDKGIRLIGDVPIYVAHDSCDVYAHREQFLLDTNGFPTAVAGCPPDYFSKDGQLWGNPLYHWAAMEANGYAWWKERISHMLTLFDGVRIDHFRGLAGYWSIPADAETAAQGHWEKGPGKPLVDALRGIAEEKQGIIIAEDLGDITEDVAELVRYSTFPGMRVFQFAFLGDPASPHLPHNFVRNAVAYTGTHDNNTLLGYVWESREEDRRRMLRYCGFNGTDWNCRESYDAILRTMYESVADLVILPIQDLLGFGADTRMNIPGNPEGNWRFRVTAEQLACIDTAKWRDMAELYGRL